MPFRAETQSLSLLVVDVSVQVPFAVVFGGLAIVMGLIGFCDALAGVAFLAVLVGAPLALMLLVARSDARPPEPGAST